MPRLTLEIVTVERKVYEDEVDSVTLPTQIGEISVLSGHIPLVTSLAEGELKVRKGERVEYFISSGGFAEIQPDRIIVLADVAEHAEEIDIKKAEEAKRNAEETMKKKGIPPADFHQAAAELRRSLIRLKIARKVRKTKRLIRPETEV